MKSQDLLLEDHGQILRLLNVLEEMAARVQRGEAPIEKDVKVLWNF